MGNCGLNCAARMGYLLVSTLPWVDFCIAYRGLPEGHGRLRSISLEVVQKQVIGISDQGAYGHKDRMKPIVLNCWLMLG